MSARHSRLGPRVAELEELARPVDPEAFIRDNSSLLTEFEKAEMRLCP